MKNTLPAKSCLSWLCILAFALPPCLSAAPYPRPGQAANTPVTGENMDAEVFREWQNGREQAPAAGDGRRGPGWLLWTRSGENPGHSGLSFGLDKEPGPRHLRIGFKEPVPVGTLLVRGNVQVSVLRPTAVYPGDLGNDAEWLPGERLQDDRVVTSQAGRDDLAFWVFPAGTLTRGVRFTHHARATDAQYDGWLGGAVVYRDRFINLGPSAAAASQTNNRHAARLNNGHYDGWGAWDNGDMNSAEIKARPAVSPEHPEWLQLTWPEPVELDGLLTEWTGFGAADILAYTGPEGTHPLDASENDWTLAARPAGFECGYPTTLWPNFFPFEKRLWTRAIKIRITDKMRGDHPHIKNKDVDGRRVWLGELMPVRNLGGEDFKAPEAKIQLADAPQPPIPVRFTLPEEGYVTLVVEDANGLRIRNLVSETWFPAGENCAWWDGTDDLGRDIDAARHGLYNIPAKLVAPGMYSVRGLWRKEIKPVFEFAVYASGNPPWSTPDHTGAWLANHSPPSAAVFVPASHSPTGKPSVFLGCHVTEGPDGLAWVDLDGRKRGGMKWIGGNWTAAPFLGRDTAADADPNIAAYVASVWETEKKSGVDELRITALVKSGGNQLQTRPIHKATLEAPANDNDPAVPAKAAKRESLGGVAAFAGTVACSFPRLNQVLFISAASGEISGRLSVADPRGLVYDPAGRLFLISGARVLQYTPQNGSFTGAAPKVIASRGLEDPSGITLDADGHVYVSDRGGSHQVKVFWQEPPPRPKAGLFSRGEPDIAATPAGEYTLVRTIGRPGQPQAGPYDPLHMNTPAGIAVDSDGQLWVTENDYLPKRVSVWSPTGELIRAFYGPGKYGGGGQLDSQDASRFYYADEAKGTLEFKVDWQAGKAELAAVLYRQTADSFEMPFRSAAPETALYHNGKRYLTNCYNSNPTNGHGAAFIYQIRDGVAQPAAAMGLANSWSLLKTAPFLPRWPAEADPNGDTWRNGGKNQALFFWSDLNEDGDVQPAEVELHQTPVGGITVMADLSFCAARLGDKAMRFRPSEFTGSGVPVYDFGAGEVLAEGVMGSASSGGSQLLADDSDEAIVTLGVAPFHQYSVTGMKGGKAVWSYPNPWPGLHASHHAAKPDCPGQLIGVTRLLGGFVHPQGGEVGPLWAVNGNMGNIYLMTRDGLFVATVFEDVRQGRLWKMSVAERGMSLKGITLHDENFWPSISQTPDGRIYLVDGSNCSLVRLDGLESLRAISAIPVKVTPADLEASQQYVIEQEARRQKTFGSGVLKAAIRREAPSVDGNLDDWRTAGWVEIDRRGAGANFNSDAKPYNILGALAVADGRLYAAWQTNEAKLLANSGEIPNARFKTGGALDLMIGGDPSAPPERRQPVAGDLRLLITRVGGETRATVYRQVQPGVPKDQKIPFSSPWRTILFDQVEEVSDQVQLADNGKGDFEVSVPLATLGLTVKPGMIISGDMGILRGNGSETTARSYWSNKATGITADVPSEAELTPSLWGRIIWQEE